MTTSNLEAPQPKKIDLVWISGKETLPNWQLGRVFLAQATPASIDQCIQHNLDASDADAWLFWDETLGDPDLQNVLALLVQPDDVWHAGLILGMGGMPGSIDFVSPTWMLNRDPDPSIEATSWRMSLRCCLIRTEALRRLGGPQPSYQSLQGASLEMGHRYIGKGAFVRSVPELLPGRPNAERPELPFTDELRFIFDRFGRVWSFWALGRAVLTGYVSLVRGLSSFKASVRWLRFPEQQPFSRTYSLHADASGDCRVTVLIPTLKRYPYLRQLLDQLRSQTVAPLEIIVVDQTPPGLRDQRLQQDFADLPVKWILQDEAGQCSSRNAGLMEAQGDYILIVDDDIEAPIDLVKKHLENLFSNQCEVSCGVVQEVGAHSPIPDSFRRISDVFPAGNTMICRGTLVRSGLFDLAFNKGQRADFDLGMRIYLSGARMILDPSISVLHHHAPMGGLREHKARIITYASSRRRLFHRNLPSATEQYISKRYFSCRQQREALLLKNLRHFSP